MNITKILIRKHNIINMGEAKEGYTEIRYYSVLMFRRSNNETDSSKNKDGIWRNRR